MRLFVCMAALGGALFITPVTAFELGEVRLMRNATDFKAVIPIKDLVEDRYSTLGGQIVSGVSWAESVTYRMGVGHDPAVRVLELISPEPLHEVWDFTLILSYRGVARERSYTIEAGLGIKDAEHIELAGSDSTIPATPVRTASLPAFDRALIASTQVVGANTSLYEIAETLTPDAGTVYQRAVAVYAINQAAFINGDINRLIAGVTLHIPDANYVSMIDQTVARRLFFGLVQGTVVLEPMEIYGAFPQDSSASPIIVGSTNPPATGLARVQDLKTTLQALDAEKQQLGQTIQTLMRQLETTPTPGTTPAKLPQ